MIRATLAVVCILASAAQPVDLTPSHYEWTALALAVLGMALGAWCVAVPSYADRARRKRVERYNRNHGHDARRGE